MIGNRCASERRTRLTRCLVVAVVLGGLVACGDGTAFDATSTTGVRSDSDEASGSTSTVPEPSTVAPPPESGEIVAEPAVATPGSSILLWFPTERERGVPFLLSRWNGSSWDDPTFLLISDGGGPAHYACGECPTSYAKGEDWGWEDIGVGGPGPDRVIVPPSATPGTFRACTANSPSTACAQLVVIDAP